jgi:predicted dehydrogenase
MTPVRIGAVGCGYWGPNLIRNFVEIPESDVVGVADLDLERLGEMSIRYPQIGAFTPDYQELAELGIDGVVISTPPETHYDIASFFLENGIDVLVEKPLTVDSKLATRLTDMAAEYGRVLMVGHTFEFNPAVRALREMIDSGELGRIRYIDAIRVGLGLFHPTLNVIWDLAPHDISILLYLLQEYPETVSTRGIACVQDSVEDVAYMTLSFPSGIMAHARMSWLDPRKTRRITVVGANKMVVYDDVAAEEKLKIYDKRVDAIRHTETYGEFQFAYHYGSVMSPHVRFEEPLRVECRHFLESVANRTAPLTDGVSGTRVVKVIEAAQESLRNSGQAVEVEPVERDHSVVRLTPSAAS